MSEAKILIVEDEFLIAQGLARKLEKLGYQVIDIVASGAEAIQRTREFDPDLILMDIVIEGDRDGIETAAEIYESYFVPVIYVTAYADDQILKRAQVTGSYGYILKPFNERELHATIQIALSKHRQAIQLQKSLENAENKCQEKSQHLSRASHNLRNRMTVIQAIAGILHEYGEQLTSQKRQKHLDLIRTSIQNMDEILEDVLFLNRSETVQHPCRLQLIDLIEFCQNLLEEYQAIATEKHRIKLINNSSYYRVDLDRKLLHYILTNLLSNAIKYSPNGGQVILEISCNLQQVIFRVKDEGIGIPQNYFNKLFQQFERASNVGNIKGTGLGLSIVKQAVDLHHGEVSVESELGRGTTFTVKLPLTLSSEQIKVKPDKVSGCLEKS
ncbi:ATP-binding protein [Capilliphycus salinus ALCB114379]|uniref:hybrid sensor histidine kinase/response regulator n=1 Tax=Capilliphycus salinus TaxID=2768948 RepID=UPI0039A46DBA